VSSLYERVVFNRILEWSLDRPGVRAIRRAALAPARGEVVEIGVGTGLNLPHYPAQVRSVTSVGLEPRLDPRAARRAAAAGVRVDHVRGDGQRLPLPDASFDTAVAMLVLCSIPDAISAVRELRRVLKPGGQLLFLEHIIDTPGVGRRAQRLAEPVLYRVNCGCSLLRDTRPVIERGGFRFTSIEEEHMPAMPLLYRRMIRGVASPRPGSSAAARSPRG
jgi:SAM-dependent methyltransferase